MHLAALYRASGADLPFGSLTSGHEVAMEGYFWRFWTERKLGALLGKSTLIPVLHNVTSSDVKEYSGILPDLAGFTTAQDSITEIAAKIAAAILVTE